MSGVGLISEDRKRLKQQKTNFPPTMWLKYYQPLVTDLVQKALIQLCTDHVPYDGKLEIDGIVCISNGNIDKQIVVKVHEVIGNYGIGQQEESSGGAKAKGHILQVPGFKRRVEGEQSEQQPKKQLKTEIQLSPRSIPLNLSQDGRERSNSQEKEGSGKESPTAGSKDPKRMSISLLKLLSSDQPSDTLRLVKAKDRVSPQRTLNMVESPSSSRECSPVSDAILSRALKCKICSVTVANISQLVSHTSEAHKRYLCKHCLNSFSLRCNLHRHERLHSGIKPFPCNKCGKSFARNADLKLHLQKHDSSGDSEAANTTCQRCSKVFISTQSLRYHLFKVHRVQDGIYACTICEKVYDDEDAYNKHWESHTDSLVQHGQIKVTPKASDVPDLATEKTDDKKLSPGKIHKNVTYKSLLQPKFKPLVFPKDVRENNGQMIKQETTDDMEDGEMSSKSENSTSLSETNIPEHNTDSEARHSSSGIDFDAIKKEFGPLFRYNDLMNEADSDDDARDDLSLSTSLNIPSFGRSSRGTSPALSDSHANHVSSKNKRKSRPFKHITESEKLENDLGESRASDASLTPIVVRNSSKHLMSGATLIKVSSDQPMPYTTEPSREQSPADSLDELVSISYMNPDSPSVTPKAKLKPIPALDKEPQGSPSAEVLADDEITYECRYGGCGQKFFGFKAYEDHFFCGHSRFPCKLCDQSFTCKNNRTRHIRNHLGIAKRHPCDRCTKTFTRPDTLQEHKFIHTQSYKADHCNGCGATFDRKALLLAHMKKCFRNKPELLEKDMLDHSTH